MVPGFSATSVDSMSSVASFNNNSVSNAFPPAQTIATGPEDMELSFDTDMVDEDEARALALEQQGIILTAEAATAKGGSVQIDSGMDVEEPTQITPEKVHLRGVDDMNPDQVKAFASRWAPPGVELVKIEWVDDSSCNLVYADSTIALQALNAFTDGEPTLEQQRDILLLRQAKPTDSHSDIRLEVRIARADDQKIRGARERSRFYLFNPEYDHVEQRERRRRGQDAERRSQRQTRPSDDALQSGDYNRRFYDRTEQERRTFSHSALSYDENFYDDDAATRAARYKDRRSRDIDSRSRSRSPPRSDRERGGRRNRRSGSRSPLGKKNKNVELFPTFLGDKRLMGLSAVGTTTEGRDFFDNPPSEIIKGGEHILESRAKESFPSHSSGSKKNTTELFPKKASGGLFSDNMSASPRSLADRIEPAPRSLAERIELFPEKATGQIGVLKENKGDLMSRIEMDSTPLGGASGKRKGRRKAADLFG